MKVVYIRHNNYVNSDDWSLTARSFSVITVDKEQRSVSRKQIITSTVQHKTLIIVLNSSFCTIRRSCAFCSPRIFLASTHVQCDKTFVSMVRGIM